MSNEETPQDHANRIFPYKIHACPHCEARVVLYCGVNFNAPLPGDAYVLQCDSCLYPYYLSWLGPWDGEAITLAGFQRFQREQRFSERMLKERGRKKE